MYHNALSSYPASFDFERDKYWIAVKDEPAQLVIKPTTRAKNQICFWRRADESMLICHTLGNVVVGSSDEKLVGTVINLAQWKAISAIEYTNIRDAIAARPVKPAKPIKQLLGEVPLKSCVSFETAQGKVSGVVVFRTPGYTWVGTSKWPDSKAVDAVW